MEVSVSLRFGRCFLYASWGPGTGLVLKMPYEQHRELPALVELATPGRETHKEQDASESHVSGRDLSVGSGVAGLHGFWVRKGLDEQVAFEYRPEGVSGGAMLTSRPRDTASAKALR